MTFQNYAKALGETPLLRYFLNSLMVALFSVAGPGRDGLHGRLRLRALRFRGRDALFFAVLATMMVPVYINLVPLYALMSLLGWVDTYQALIVPGLVGRLRRVPVPAVVPGLAGRAGGRRARATAPTPWQLYWLVALPTALPAIATLAIFEFLASWNTFLWPLVVTNSDSLRTLPVGLAAFVAHEGGDGLGLADGSDDGGGAAGDRHLPARPAVLHPGPAGRRREGLKSNRAGSPVNRCERMEEPPTCFVGILAALAVAVLAAPAQAKSTEHAVFGGGCFWAMQSEFELLKGVESAIPGYAAARRPTPPTTRSAATPRATPRSSTSPTTPR